MKEYSIVVVTGDCESAGTDCGVFIKLFGRTGISPRIQLVNSLSENKSHSMYYSPFARGMSSKFTVNAPSVGTMTHVRISQDGRGDFPHWFLERIVVTDLSYPKWTYYFHGSVWLSPTYADRKLFRMIRGTREPTGSGVGKFLHRGNQYNNNNTIVWCYYGTMMQIILICYASSGFFSS